MFPSVTSKVTEIDISFLLINLLLLFAWIPLL